MAENASVNTHLFFIFVLNLTASLLLVQCQISAAKTPPRNLLQFVWLDCEKDRSGNRAVWENADVGWQTALRLAEQEKLLPIHAVEYVCAPQFVENLTTLFCSDVNFTLKCVCCFFFRD